MRSVSTYWPQLNVNRAHEVTDFANSSALPNDVMSSHIMHIIQNAAVAWPFLRWHRYSKASLHIPNFAENGQSLVASYKAGATLVVKRLMQVRSHAGFRCIFPDVIKYVASFQVCPNTSLHLRYHPSNWFTVATSKISLTADVTRDSAATKTRAEPKGWSRVQTLVSPPAH